VAVDKVMQAEIWAEVVIIAEKRLLARDCHCALHDEASIGDDAKGVDEGSLGWGL
jgi:hypothetical protein